jgi:hypothetical protein
MAALAQLRGHRPRLGEANRAKPTIDSRLVGRAALNHGSIVADLPQESSRTPPGGLVITGR